MDGDSSSDFTYILDNTDQLGIYTDLTNVNYDYNN